MKYQRILLKLSGEWLANKESNLSIDYQVVKKIAKQLKVLVDQKIQVAIVIGGGNFWRGASAEKNGIPRSRADYIGMMATLMNSLALQSVLEDCDLKARVFSAFQVDQKVAQPFILEKVNKYLNRNEIAIMAGGTGRPYFTTDTAATLVAAEIKADVLLLGKNNVAGIYDDDPKINPNAKHYEKISYDQVLEKDLKVMDASAVAMARDNNLKLLVFNIGEPDAIIKAIEHKGKFTEVVK